MDEVLHRALGLTDAEAAEVERVLGRSPNELELSMFAVMWSEHCSYKSSRLHLRRLPSEASWVLVGPNEGAGAGVVDAGDGIAIAMRIESHNHPSAVEPYQGAATGVGGILRDVFTMGARPIAVMDPLRFGPLDDARNRWIFEGVVRGISGYGNSVGVPTVGGEVVFDDCYSENPLVNVFCLGVMPVGRLTKGRASGPGNLAVLVGSSTGRDGIGGASVLASAGFDAGGGSEDGRDDKRPSVQVGDPFEEKRLIEACLEILDRGLAVGVQDLGAAGITGAVSETASKGGVGMDVWIDQIPQRESDMVPTEVMTSESQERMLVIVTPQKMAEVVDVCERWEVRAAVIGQVTDGGRLRILDRRNGQVLGDMPAAALDEDRPLYDRPMAKPEPSASPAPKEDDPETRLLESLADPSWVYRQYDHQLFLNTVVAPGGDAAVLKLKGPGLPATTKAIALSTDGNARWCAADPRRGTALIVAESCLNVACAGARPVALVNCLNFGNPEHPEVMWQLSESIDGMAEACRALGVPVIGGNVSLYNESGGADIDPTPVVAVLGLIDNLVRRPPGVTLVDGADLLLLGGAPAGALDYALHSRLLALVAEIVNDDLVAGIHDVSDGGLGLALAEMAVDASLGWRVTTEDDLFDEAPSRVVVCTTTPEEVAQRAVDADVTVTRLGRVGGDRLIVEGLLDIPLETAARAWRGAIPEALAVGG